MINRFYWIYGYGLVILSDAVTYLSDIIKEIDIIIERKIKLYLNQNLQ